MLGIRQARLLLRPVLWVPTGSDRLMMASVIMMVLLMVTATTVMGDPPSVWMHNRRCLDCHGQRHIAELSPAERSQMVRRGPGESEQPFLTAPDTQPPEASPPPETRPGLYLGPDVLTTSVHSQLACVDCHPTSQSLPHPSALAPAACATRCHPTSGAAFRRSSHAEALAKASRRAPTCATCHGGHDILPQTNRQSRVYPLNIINVCADCHEQHLGRTPAGHNEREYIQTYLASVHGKAVTQGGLVVAATCVDCHHGHDVRPAADPQSAVHRRNVPHTCGQCHIGIAEIYQGSIHGQKLEQGDPEAPVCTDCHTAHSITDAATPKFMRDITGECGRCHDKPLNGDKSGISLYRTYRRSYHGQVTQLGSTRAARCSDCHGAHNILPVSDEASPLHASHRIAVCASCHQGANANFIKFQPHADYRNADRYPLLHSVWLYFILVMSVTFGFYGLHSLLWFIRSLIHRLKHGPAPRTNGNAYAIRRFNRVQRANHAVMVVTFFGLTLTGMPLFFADQDWARTLARLLGGIGAAGIYHRIFAVMLMGNFAVHIGGVINRISKNSVSQILLGPNSMLPRWKDVTDCIGMFRWFFGGHKPRFDRWTYWEKFDYWAEIFGTFVIGGTGLMLWFPTFFSLLMPGWMFNVAMIVHGYEALLAIGFIFTIHFFNAHLRLEKFPVDDVIFTGRLSEEEFKHERSVEYERVKASGMLQAMRVAPARRWQRLTAVIVGTIAMAIGAAMVVLIILAGLEAL